MSNRTRENVGAVSPIEEVLAEALDTNMVQELWASQETEIGQSLIFKRLSTLPEGSYLIGDEQFAQLQLKAARLGWGLAADDELPAANLLWDNIADSVGPLHSHDLTSGTYTLSEDELRNLLEKEYQNAQILQEMGYELDRGV